MRTELTKEREEMKRYYFVLLGYASFKQVLTKLKNLLDFYRIDSEGKSFSRETIYDVPNNLLTESGIVLSKKTEGERTFFNVLKISMLPDEIKKLNENRVVREVNILKEPKDYSFEIAKTIEAVFHRTFSFDLDSFIRNAKPYIEITVDSNNYEIVGGTGLRGFLSYEKTTYRDIKSGKRENGEGVVLRLPSDSSYEKENEEILALIERNIQELGQYNISKFELGKKLLFPPEEPEETTPKNEEE